MKKIVYLFIAIFTSTLFYGQEKVGENQNGKFVITANLKYLKEQWNKLAGEEVINYKITASDSEGIMWYYIIGSTESGTKLATSLEFRDNTFYVPINKEAESSSTCTCTGCRWQGCDPLWLSGHKKWICDMPCLSCKKTVTKTITKFSEF